LETGIKEYVIEYSNNGINFNTLGTSNASGILKDYSFTHAASQGRAFYRLKIISEDGKYEYSKTIVLPVNCLKNAALVYPNPVNDILNVNATIQPGNTLNNLFLYDAAGKILYQSPINNGSNTIAMSRFAKGVYHLKLIMGNNTQNYKIQK
jgi:Secretion system C-terminal sorting domain